MIFGQSVAIGPILPVDIPSLFRWADDADAARLNEPYRPLNWHRQETFWTNADNDPSRVFFAIRRRNDPAIVGYVQITGIQPIHRSAQIGLRIGEPANRRKGLGREALALALDYSWKSLNLSRIGLSIFAHNAGAVALYRAFGFEEEGLLRRALFIDGAWIDVLLMGLCRADRGLPADRPMERDSPSPG